MNLINFIFYDIILSNTIIIIWRGFYHFLDKYVYPDNIIRSAWICLLIGYILLFFVNIFSKLFEQFKIRFWILDIYFDEFSSILSKYWWSSCFFLMYFSLAWFLAFIWFIYGYFRIILSNIFIIIFSIIYIFSFNSNGIINKWSFERYKRWKSLFSSLSKLLHFDNH